MNSKEFFYQFGKLFYKIDSFYAELAKEQNVKPNLMWILYALGDEKPHSQKEISTSWDIPLTTINTIVIELHKDGYIEFVQIPGEKREKNIVLTNKGKDLSNKVLHHIYEIEEKVYSVLDERKRMVDDMEYLLGKYNELKGEQK